MSQSANRLAQAYAGFVAGNSSAAPGDPGRKRLAAFPFHLPRAAPAAQKQKAQSSGLIRSAEPSLSKSVASGLSPFPLPFFDACSLLRALLSPRQFRRPFVGTAGAGQGHQPRPV